ncbi:MAG: lysoplasmalogenase family protein [Dermatophilaceae bacterium]
MNLFAWVLLAALGVAAGATWWSMSRHRPDVEGLSRPAFHVLLLALAWLLRADTVDYGRFLLLGLVLSLVGDWLRHGRLAGSPLGERAGWAALLLSRVAYAVALVLVPGSSGRWLGIGLVAVLVAWAARLARVPAARARWRHGILPLGYAVIVAAVPVAAWSTASVGLGVGAVLVLAGDAVLGYERFSRPLAWGPLAVQVLHDVAEVLLVLGMLRG